MNRYPMILLITILLICVGLSGCEDQKVIDESYFVGSWSLVDIFEYYIYNVSEIELTMTFYSNNTVLTITNQNNNTFQSLSYYRVEDNKIYFTPIGESHNYSQIYEYEFSNGGNSLKLIFEYNFQNNAYMILERI